MSEVLTDWNDLAGLALAFATGAALACMLMMGWVRLMQRPAKQEVQRLRKTLRMTQVQLEQARKNAEALSDEVQGWRQRGSQWQSARAPKPSVHAPVAPADIAPADADMDVIGALLSDDSHLQRRRSGSARDSKPGFADTQVLPGFAH